MNCGFFIARKQPDGSPGLPVGNDDGAVMLFDDLQKSLEVRNSLTDEHGELSVFRVNIVLVGEVVE